VPDGFVPVFIALGDAWFPNQRDVDSVIGDFSATKPLTNSEREAIRSYVTSGYVREYCVDRVIEALHSVGVTDVDADGLQISTVDVDVDAIFGVGQSGATTGARTSVEATPTPSEAEASTDRNSGASGETEAPVGDPSFDEIPGIGAHRADSLVEAGIRSVEELAAYRPVDLIEETGLSKGLATVAVEGAREVTGRTQPVDEQLAAETGVDQGEFTSALNSLAASGVPGSRAAPTLRVLFGPTVADIGSVTGSQAYYLWEAGYQTPKDVVDASVAELTEIYDIGEATAPEIQENAATLLEEHEAK